MPTAARARARAAPTACLMAAVIALQISYPLVSDAARDASTVVIVMLAAAAALTHAATSRGPATAIAVAMTTALGGYLVEVLGVHTRLPFGGYAYAGSLGPELLRVPVLIALAWTMLAWPAALAARRLVLTTGARVVVGGWALASWDVFLDPQMVAAGHWHWDEVVTHLPGVPDVPLSNFLGWLVVATAMSWVLQCGVLRGDSPRPSDGWPLGFYIWTWASSSLALGMFFGLPFAALWGCAAMGLVAVPLLVRLIAGARRARVAVHA